MSNRVVLVSLVSALCLAGSIAQADTAPPAPAPPKPIPVPYPLMTPWEAKARTVLDGTNISACKKANGPTGRGEATIAVAPNGNVNSVAVTDVADGGKFAGTPVGGCVAGKYRGVHFDPYNARSNETSVTIHYVFALK